MRNALLFIQTSLLLFIPFVAFAQVSSLDNPNVDNQIGIFTPQELRHQPTHPVLNVITSSEGYDNFDLGLDFAEPHVSVNPLEPREYFAAYNINGTHHTENGHDWAINNPAFASAAGDPVTAYDGDGNLYYMTMRLAGASIVGTWVVKSTDNGATWGVPISSVPGYDKCWMAADQSDGPFGGYLYGVMTPGNFSRTTNGGASWSQTWTFTTQDLPGMMVAVGPNGATDGGCVYVVTNSGSPTASIYTFYRSTDGGSTFTLRSSQTFSNYVGSFVGGRNSVENSRTRPYPFIAADNSAGPYRGRLYCVYASNDPPGNGNKPDIWCRYSNDQGTTWSAAIRINDDPNPTQNHQWTPAIWNDMTTGRLYAKWYDTRECAPLDDSTDVFASYSDDGGVTWAENQKLTTRKFKINCATCGGGGTPRYQGDYDAIASVGQTSMAVWTDFRNGNFMSTTAYFPDFAMLLSDNSASGGTTGSATVAASVPDVKLYSDVVSFSASVEPAANFSFSYPDGNTLNTFPGSIDVDISWTNVAEGNYVVTIQGEGPNGTPVHRRTVDITVAGSGITCGDIFFFNAKCNMNGAAQAMVKMTGDWTGETVTFDLDGDDYVSNVMSNGTNSIAKMTVPHAGMGPHTVTLEVPGGCYSPVGITCMVDAPPDPEWDALWAEYDVLEQAQAALKTLPAGTRIIGSYPNPFNPSTTIRYALGGDARVSVKIYNTLGQLVRTIVDADQSEGYHEAVWDGRNETGSSVSSGIYVYRLVTGEVTQTRRIVLMK